MKIILSTYFIFLICINGFGQYDIEEVEKDSIEKEKKLNPFNLKQNIYFGGEFSLRFGTYTYLYTAPFVGYDLYKGFSVGVSTMYQLYRQKYNNGAVVSYHSFGGGLFLRYRPEFLNFLLLQTEFDIINTNDFNSGGFDERVNVPVFMSGLGYAGSMGERAYYQILLMYDFIDDFNNPLPSLFLDIPLYLKYGFVFYLD